MGFYERFKPRGTVSFNPKEAVKRYSGFRYGEGMRIEIGDTVIVADDREAGMFKVRMLNPSGMRVTISKQSDVRQVEPSELMFVHRR